MRRAACLAAHPADAAPPDNDLNESMAMTQMRQQLPQPPKAYVWHVFLELAYALCYPSNGLVFHPKGRVARWQHIVYCFITPYHIFLHNPALSNTQEPQPPWPYEVKGSTQYAVRYPNIALDNF
jgi:hypothetical protein